jgi:hypothetical protein
MNPDDEKRVMEKEFREANDLLDQIPPVCVQMSVDYAWCLLSTIQLACRHPRFSGPARDMVVEFAKSLQAQIAPPGTALGRLAAAGWRPECDVPTDR